MRPETFGTKALRRLFLRKHILDFSEVRQALGKPARATVYRKLKALSARTSYSHHGRFHVLEEIVQYDHRGLWGAQNVWFSRHGTLLETVVHLVGVAPNGHLASELEEIMHVRVHNALIQLFRAGRLNRQPLGREYLYLSPTREEEQRRDRLKCRQLDEAAKGGSIAPISLEVAQHMRLLLTALNEKQRRLYLGLESIRLGGDLLVSRATGVNVKTIARGRRELIDENVDTTRIRKLGAGRPSKKKTEVIALLEEIMADDTAGDATAGNVRWSRKDPRMASDELKNRGVDISPNTVAKALKELNYSLRRNRKSIAETKHPDRNRQFEIISELKKRFEDWGDPIIYVDSKKKELIGNFRNPGSAWGNKYEDVYVHDFRSYAEAIVSPWGVYESLLNLGTIILGTSADTPEFAVDSLEMWLTSFGWTRYPKMSRLLIFADSGGSNGCRPRYWKHGLHSQIAKQHGIHVTVCHYPSGASKWNYCDRRLFSFISKKWAGHPLRSIELMMQYIRGTTTKKGLRVEALLNDRNYAKGKKLPDREFRELPIRRHKELPQWNYSFSPN